jgi:hypothetical protein
VKHLAANNDLEAASQYAAEGDVDAGVVHREKDGRSYEYALDREFLERRIDAREAMGDAE